MYVLSWGPSVKRGVGTDWGEVKEAQKLVFQLYLESTQSSVGKCWLRNWSWWKFSVPFATNVWAGISLWKIRTVVTPIVSYEPSIHRYFRGRACAHSLMSMVWLDVTTCYLSPGKSSLPSCQPKGGNGLKIDIRIVSRILSGKNTAWNSISSVARSTSEKRRRS